MNLARPLSHGTASTPSQMGELDLALIHLTRPTIQSCYEQ